MNIKHINLIFLFLLSISLVNAQSFYLTKENKKVFTETIEELESGYQKLKLKDNTSTIGYENILGKYNYDDDTFYFFKKYKSKIPLSKKEKLSYIPMSRITEGDIRLYEGVITSGVGNTEHLKTVWLIEKAPHFNKIHEQGLITSKKMLFEKLLAISEGEPFILNRLTKPDFIKSVDNILNVIHEYNHTKHSGKPHKVKDEIVGKIVLYRDGSKQSKEPVELFVNGKSYVLDKKQKTEIILNTRTESLIEISNCTNKAKKLIKPNENFTSYYEIKLDKKDYSEILQKNGNNSFIKIRLKTMKTK